MGLFDVGGKVLQYGIPAAIGAYQGGSMAAQRGQNPFQIAAASALGGGIGLGIGGASRFAGQALQGGLAANAAEKLAAGGLSPGAVQQAMPGLLKAAAPAGNLANVGTGLLLSAIPAGSLAAGTTGLIGQTARAAVGPAATVGAIQQPGSMQPDVAVPPDVQARNKPLDWGDIISGAPAVARANEWLQAEQDRAEAVKTAQAMYPIMSQAKKDEMQRNLAAAQIRSNIATNAQLMLGGAQTAQQMGLNAASQMGQALAAQYQYG
jgi:hypothetical protein